MSRSMQLWPEGKSVTVRGEYPKFELRDESDNWHSASADEARQIQIEELAESYQRNLILACQSALVDDLLRNEFDGFSSDDIQNLYPNCDAWDVTECREWLDEHGVDFPQPNPWEMTREELVEALTEVSIECRDDESDDVLLKAVIENIDDETIDGLTEWREAVRDNAEANEIFEWYAVDSWLAKQLADFGEPVIDNDYGYWWGRCCTGQALIMDGTLQKIAAASLAE